jgi:quinol monooxygenase YgiN
MMISILQIVPTVKKREAVLDILNSVETLARVKTGCINCALYEACTDEREILYIEQWRTKDELYRHIQSDLYFRILAAMELALRVPELRFHEMSEPMGMELIKSLRAQEAKR